AVAIDANAVAARRLVGAQGAAGGAGAAVRLHGFQVDPQLHGEASGRRYAGLFQTELGQAGPGGQAYLQLDQIEPGDGLGHRVFDLDPRVGFHEYEVAVVLVDQKLDGAQAAITDRRGEGAGGVQQSPAQVGIQPRCRRHFDDLLMTALQAAFPLPQVADLLAVTGDLHFDMPGPGNQPLDIELAIAEGGPGFGAAALECVRQLGGVGDQPHAPAATPGQRLEQ